jgi:hypothetical protein
VTILVPVESIVSKIIVLRGEKTLLDRDLAELYGLETKALKQAVRRNAKRFPDDFMFELSEDEFKNLRSQIVTSRWGGSRYRPMAFTEQGVAMLSSVLKSDRAIEVNIAIMRAFVQLRKIMSSKIELTRKLGKIDKQLEEHDEHIHTIFEALRQLMVDDEKARKQIGFGVKEPKTKYSGKTKAN